MSDALESGMLSEASLKRFRRKEALDKLAFWVAIFSLLATMHADVFEQEDNRLASVFLSPLSRLVPYSRKPDLSSLLAVRSSGASSKDKGNGSPLYVFMFDVSQSMREQEVSEQEVGQYLEDIRADRFKESHSPVAECLVREGRAKGFDIAISELCRYIDSLPLNARAALWQFGVSARQIVPSDYNVSSPRFRLIAEDQDGGTSKGEFFAAVRSLQANQGRSDFEDLLEKVAARYRDEIESDREVHFVLISDFVHDIGGETGSSQDLLEGIDAIEDSFWQSRYRMSLLSIGNRFRDMSGRRGKTFHLAVIRGARRAVCSVLPIAGEMVGRDAYRELRFESGNLGSQFDFLRAYEHVEEPIIFYYTQGGDKPKAVKILVDDEKYDDTRLSLGLASKAEVTPAYPLEVRAYLQRKEQVGGLVRIGDSFSGLLGSKHDHITLQPESTIDPREAASYRLLLSWEGGESAGDTHHRTFAIRLVFKKQLSMLGALAMVFAMATIAFWVVRLISLMLPSRGRRKVRKSISNISLSDPTV